MRAEGAGLPGRRGKVQDGDWGPAGVWVSGARISSCPQRRFPALFDNEYGARAIFETT